MSPRKHSSRRLLAAVLAMLLPVLPGCGQRETSPLSPDSGPPPESTGGAAVPGTPVSVGDVPDAPGGYDNTPYVIGQLVAEVSPGWSAARIDREWGTDTVERIPGSPFALLAMPEGADYAALATDLLARGACVTCSRNFHVEAPEAKQASIAFYEGDLTTSDFADQDALLRVHAAAAHQHATGEGVTVAIVDTGIDRTHPDLTDRVRQDGWDFVDGDSDPMDAVAGQDKDYDGLYDEAAGHGTHVAGIVHAMAPDALLLPVRVLDTEGLGTVFDLARGIRFADDRGARIINLSLGMNGASPVVRWAIQRAVANDRLVVASAGNEGVFTNLHFPASLPVVVGVAAVNSWDRKTGFSNFGNIVDLSAPGEGIISTYLYHGYAVWSGTSMATPFVAGAAAVATELLPGATAAVVRDAVEGAAKPLRPRGEAWDGLMGAGRVDLFPLVVEGAPAP
jgi:subtilisin family serine protease